MFAVPLADYGIWNTSPNRPFGAVGMGGRVGSASHDGMVSPSKLCGFLAGCEMDLGIPISLNKHLFYAVRVVFVKIPRLLVFA